MKNLKILLLFLFLSCQLQAQQLIQWNEIEKGLSYAEIDAPEKSFINDSKLCILKINPDYFRFYLLCASEHGKTSRTAPEWAEEFDMNIVVNAGMYSLKNHSASKGYMKNYRHINNQKFNNAYNGMIAMNPVDTSEKQMKLFDIKCGEWLSFKNKHHSYSQVLRMIDCNGKGMVWNKNPGQSCSMLVVSTDSIGNIYFIFSRSPYTHNTMIKFILSMPLNILSTFYLEGGPETSLYINCNGVKIEKFGSYVSKTFEKDDNDHFWKIPNVIGIKRK